MGAATIPRFMRRPPVRLGAAILFFLSGATALAYEVAWTRHLVLVFGNTTRAVALILAAYMLGLALGAEVGGRVADRTRRPGLLYGAAEALIGLYALAFPALVAGVRALYLSMESAATPLLFVGAFVLLLVPTFLMGATLPLLVRATVDDPTRTGAAVGRLYGANLLGAVVGTMATGFWLMEAAGVMGATRWAAGVNVAIAVAAGVMWRRGGVPLVAKPIEEPTAGTVPLRADALRGMDPPAQAALVAVFAGGFVGLAAEVLWTRLLTFTLQGFTYTFSAMLATFLLGLALGGLVFGARAAKTEHPERTLARLMLAIGVAAAAVLVAMTFHYPLTAKLWRLVDSMNPKGGLQGKHIVQLLLASAVVMLPPAFLMGGVFPLAAAAYRRGLGDLGARIGRLYAVNTIGCVLGSLVAGFLLAPLLGLTWSAAAMSFAALAAGAVLLARNGETSPRRWTIAIVAAAASAALLVVARPDVPFLTRSHVFAGEKARENVLVDSRSGQVCQVSVVANERERYSLLYTDEFEAAGTKPEYRYMRLLAHLPVAIAQDPSRVLVICFGTGTTAGSVSTHAAVKRLDIVEISPEVLAVADSFRAVNHDVLHGAGRGDLDVAVHVDDGRNFVLRSRESWGVITLEPLMPYTPAAIHLYTQDFYRECAPRLAPGGVMCQWIPLQGMSGDDFKKLVAAFTAVFPDSAAFFVDGAVALIGGNEPMKLPYAQIAERLGDPAARADLSAVDFDDPVRALATFVAGAEELRAFVDGVEPVTDERPVLEFHPIPPRVLLKHLWENLQAMHALRERYERFPVDLAGVKDADDVDARLYVALRAGKHLLAGAVAMEESGLLARAGDRANAMLAIGTARDAYRVALSIDPASAGARRASESLEREWETGRGNAALDANDLVAAEAGKALPPRARLPRAAPGRRRVDAARADARSRGEVRAGPRRRDRGDGAVPAGARSAGVARVLPRRAGRHRGRSRGLPPRARRRRRRDAAGDVARPRRGAGVRRDPRSRRSPSRRRSPDVGAERHRLGAHCGAADDGDRRDRRSGALHGEVQGRSLRRALGVRVARRASRGDEADRSGTARRRAASRRAGARHGLRLFGPCRGGRRAAPTRSAASARSARRADVSRRTRRGGRRRREERADRLRRLPHPAALPRRPRRPHRRAPRALRAGRRTRHRSRAARPGDVSLEAVQGRRPRLPCVVGPRARPARRPLTVRRRMRRPRSAGRGVGALRCDVASSSRSPRSPPR